MFLNSLYIAAIAHSCETPHQKPLTPQATEMAQWLSMLAAMT